MKMKLVIGQHQSLPKRLVNMNNYDEFGSVPEHHCLIK